MTSQDRQRNRNNRKSKRAILVSYEGNNKTERYYFDGFNNRDANFTIKVVPGNETDPVSLVKQTIKESNKLGLILDEDDRAFCIFDTDVNPQKNDQIKLAIELADENNIKVITSAPCVELWFLLHYTYTTAPMNGNDVINKLKDYYPKYSKNCSMYSVLYDNIGEAYSRSKKLEKYHKDNGNDVQTVEANPHTDIYKIIDELNEDA